MEVNHTSNTARDSFSQLFTAKCLFSGTIRQSSGIAKPCIANFLMASLYLSKSLQSMAMPKYAWEASIKPMYRLVSLACKSFSCDSTEPQGFSARVNVNLCSLWYAVACCKKSFFVNRWSLSHNHHF